MKKKPELKAKQRGKKEWKRKVKSECDTIK
jgi:hypothetical protein